jgi:hypothetical protein
VLGIAAGVGIAPVVLKGGTTFHQGDRALWAKDIDLLLTRDDGVRLARALEAAGWRPFAGSTPHHLAPLRRPDRPPVELHLALTGSTGPLSEGAVERSTPLAGLPGARCLAPADQIEHVTTHQAIEHPGYRGRLRDLFLLADAVGKTTAAPETTAWRISNAASRPVGMTTQMALELVRGEIVTDRFESVAATWYLLDHRGPLPIDRRAGQVLNLWTTAFIVGDGAATDLWAASWEKRADGGGDGLRALLRSLVRMIWLPPLVTAGWWRARGIERTIERLLRAVDQGS